MSGLVINSGDTKEQANASDIARREMQSYLQAGMLQAHNEDALEDIGNWKPSFLSWSDDSYLNMTKPGELFLTGSSSISKNQASALSRSYLQRYSEIKRRRGQFGSAGLSLARD